MSLKYFKLTLYLIDQSTEAEPIVENYTIEELENDLKFDLPQLNCFRIKAKELTKEEFEKESK